MTGQDQSGRSMVDRFRNNQGKDVPIDYFLYVCFETEQTLKATDKDSKRIIQWPHLRDVSEEEFAEELRDLKLLDVWEDMLSWYAANFQELTGNIPWDIEALQSVAPQLIGMGRDLALVYQRKTGNEVPEFSPEGEPLHSDWMLLEGLINRFFARRSNLIMRYFEWNFGREKIQVEEDPGSRPPVGRFASQSRYRHQSGGGGGPGPRSGGGGPRGGGRSGGHDRGGGPRRGGHGQGGGGRDQNHRRATGGGFREERGGSGGGGNQRFNNNRNGYHQQGRGQLARVPDPALEAEVVSEADDALKILTGDPGLGSVTLKPQNSYYRRLQHEHIIAKGFESQSTGEGNERAVVVSRKS